jgi:dolichyl-diphosphooligosaccharide--protein glycosyltransferase
MDRDDSPALSLAPLAGGFAVAGLLVGGVHLALDWQTTVVASTPLFLLAGTVGVAAVGEALRRVDDLPVSQTRALAAVEAVGVLVLFGLLSTVLSTYGDRLFAELGRIGTRQGIVEGNSLFAANTFGWLFLFGLLLFLGIPYMGWALVRATRGEERHGWLLAGVSAWFLLVLAAFQMRFAGELSHFLAVFAGLGFVHIAERVDLARAPMPFREAQPVRGDGGDREPAFELPEPRNAAALLFLFLLISGLSIAQAPVKANQITTDDRAYQTAVWIDGYAEQGELTYPENYVFTPWGENRMYNYFVNGESESYGYAFENYQAFAASAQPDVWYERLRDRAGFVVFVRSGGDEATIYNRLTGAFGSRYEDYNGSGHYRAVHITETHQVHQLVPGANVTGRLTNASDPRANATVFLRTQNDIDGYTNPYVRRAFTDDDGRYHVRVAYPGEYEVVLPDSNATTTVTVPESAVENGDRVNAGTLDSGDSSATTSGNQTRLAAPAYQVSPS